jgi:membrane-bound lytic murein transglycosylase D
MNKIILFRPLFSALGILCLIGLVAPLAAGIPTYNLDEHEDLIRQRIPTAVSIVEPIYDSKVRSYLNTYLLQRPQQTAEMLGWAAVYFPIFEKALAEEGLPTDLKYLTIVESALNPNALSRSGAGGLWQFMKPTARECGLKISSYVDERMDPEKSTKAAVRYLKQLYAQFGNWELVMAAYNAGPGRVRSAVRRAGSNDYWKIARYLPVETRSYVPGFIAASYLMNFHDEHNIPVIYPEHAMGGMTTVLIYQGMSISELARRAGMPVDKVKQLNPSFIRNYIPASTYGYAIVLPTESAELFDANRSIELPTINYDGYVETKTVKIGDNTYKITSATTEHRVCSGENLSVIAARNNCSVSDLMKWNGLTSTNLSIGQRLEIRYTIRELVADAALASVLSAPKRSDITLSTLKRLPFENYSVKTRENNVTLNIVPDVYRPQTNTIVLQRRQSVRQVMGQTALGNATSLTDPTLPTNGCTGDVIRLN